MKITTNTNNLTSAVTVANSYVAKIGDYAGKIVIEGLKGKILVKVTDNAQTVILKDLQFVSDDLTLDGFTAFSIDAKKFLTVLKAAKTQEIILETKNDELIVKAGRSKVKVKIVHQVQEIVIPKSENYLDINEEFVSNLKKVFHSISNDNPKFELNGVLVQIKNNKLNLVATDTKKLSVITTNSNNNEIEILIPKEACKSIISLFGNSNVIAEYDDTYITVKTNTVVYSSRLINGKFPDWQRIVPKDYAQYFTIARKKLLELVKEASIFEKNISINISNGKIILKDNDDNTEVIEVCNDDSVNINFNIDANIVIDFLTSFDLENVKICFNEANLPIILEADESYKEICMPIIVNNIQKVEEVDEEQVAA